MRERARSQLASRRLTFAESLHFEVRQAAAARDSVAAPRWLVAQVAIPPARLAGAMATLRIGDFAVDRAHFVVGLQWKSASTAEIRLRHGTTIPRIPRRGPSSPRCRAWISRA